MKIYFESEILGERTCFVRLPFIIHYHFYVLDSVEMETNKKGKTERASKQTSKKERKKGNVKAMGRVRLRMGGKASVLLNKTSNITSCEKTFRFRISNQRWIFNRKKKHAYTRFRTVHTHSHTQLQFIHRGAVGYMLLNVPTTWAHALNSHSKKYRGQI